MKEKKPLSAVLSACLTLGMFCFMLVSCDRDTTGTGEASSSIQRMPAINTSPGATAAAQQAAVKEDKADVTLTPSGKQGGTVAPRVTEEENEEEAEEEHNSSKTRNKTKSSWNVTTTRTRRK